jgi:hypothetical protein
MVTQIGLFGSPELTPLGFCLYSRMTSEVYKTEVDTPEELFARVLGEAASINRLGRTTRDLQTRVVKCTDIEGGVLVRLL